MKKIVISSLVAISLVVTGCLTLLQDKTHAVSAAEWQAGNIIDDGVFYNNSDLPLAQDVQNYINSRLTCDTNGTQPATEKGRSDLTHAQYAAMVGWPGPPYVCLRDYYQVPRSDQNINNLGTGTIPAGAVSAAQIIKSAADTYGISARVLLVILQKESPGPLLTDTWPLAGQYRNAMGYGCPDTAPCDPSYEGFYNQMMNAARQFKTYKDNAASFRYKPFQDNTINWNPNAGCGGSNVYIANYATAGLYNYTPYQPNAAALNNLYGSGDGCSAYGNRNFWRLFSDWFYTTRAYDYGWRIMNQAAFADAAHTRYVNTNDLSPNTTYYFHVVGQNIGSKTWTNSGSNPVRIGTANSLNRQSPICDSSWISCSRPGTLNESSVAPGNNGSFDFAIHTPSNLVALNERFNLVTEGVTWMNDIGQYWPIATYPPNPYYYFVSQSAYYDPQFTKPVDTTNLAPNQPYYLQLKLLNGGNTVWTNSGPTPTRLGTAGPLDRQSVFQDNSWVASNRATNLQEASVAPGEVGTFQVKINTPSSIGGYKEYFNPVTEGLSWMNNMGIYWQLNPSPPTPHWDFVSQNFFTDNSQSTAFNPSSTPNGKRFFVSLKAKNTGNTTWVNSGPSPVRLGVSNPSQRTSQFYDPTWTAANRPATLKEASVNPGDVGSFEFWMQAQNQLDGTQFKEYFTPVVEGVSWMNDAGMYVPVTYNSDSKAVGYVGQGSYTDAARTTPADLTRASLNTTYYLSLTLKNTSGTTWSNSNAPPLGQLRLGTSNPKDRASNFATSSWLTSSRPAILQESSVAPGQSGTFLFSIKTPSTAITSNEYFTPVIDGGYWLNDLGIYWSISAN